MIAETILGLLPSLFGAVREAAALVSPRAGTIAKYAERFVTFAIQAEKDGLASSAILQGIGEIYVDLVEDVKLGVQ